MSHAEQRGFVVANGVELSPFGDGLFLMSGTVECLGGVVLEVQKFLAAVDGDPGDPKVETVAYSYNAKLKGRGNILRYDSPHPDHRPNDHVHRFDVFHGDDDGTVDDIEPRQWPTLGEVIEELEAWYYAHYDQLQGVI